MVESGSTGSSPIDWEAFYASFRKPGFIAGYEILERLGSGVFGLVYKARKESIGKLYAIKFLKVDDEGVRSAVVRELDAVRYFAQVDHPNLVSIEDKGEVSGIPYILMAYAGDSTLRKLLDRNQLSGDRALDLFLQVCRGVQALHDRSLVHFDLKPANIYLKGEVARVGDYGLSKLVGQSRNSLSFGRGTPHYMAPEMLSRHGDHRSDIYSLGILFYEMLAGRPPFKGDSEWEVLRKHERSEPRYPDCIGPTAQRVIARCLEKDPDDRYQSVQELLGDLLGGSVEEQGWTETDAVEVEPPAHTSSRSSVLMLAALLLMAVVGIFWIKGGQHSFAARSLYPAAPEAPTWSPVDRAAYAQQTRALHDRLERTIQRSERLLASAAVMSDMEMEWEQLAIATVPLPDSLSKSTKRSIERYAGYLRSKNSSNLHKARKQLRRYQPCQAMPVLINMMIELDLDDYEDAAFACRLHETLEELTRHERIAFLKPMRTKLSVSSSHNREAIAAWRAYWHSRYTD